jgi:cell division protein FtsB
VDFQKKSRARIAKSLDFRIIAVNLSLFLLIIYFLLHSLNGERGVFAYFKLKKEIVQQSKLLASLQDERSSLEIKAKLLHPKTLDLDMLDEQARKDLSMIAPDEKVVILGDKYK